LAFEDRMAADRRRHGEARPDPGSFAIEEHRADGDRRLDQTEMT
jgi:hypothetical protein